MNYPVTVIIPTYNSSGTLKLTLESVLLQDHTDLEIWVVGDGCTDDSESVVSSFGDHRLKWVNLPENTGSPNTPRNEGFKRARGEYIAYLGHDDLWFPWHLSGLLECIERGPYDIVYSLGVFIGPDGVDDILGLPAKSLNPHWLLSPSNWLHRNALLSGLGGWPPSDKYAADMILLKRMWKTRVKIGFQRQLSVLKFASGVWRNYVLKDEYPQSAYLEALTKNPEGLRRDLLQDIMTAASTSRVKFRRKQKPARALLRRTMILASNIYGIHRWPVNQLLRWLWRRDSGLNRKRR